MLLKPIVDLGLRWRRLLQEYDVAGEHGGDGDRHMGRPPARDALGPLVHHAGGSARVGKNTTVAGEIPADLPAPYMPV